MKNFTNLYSLSKTLRFELKPESGTGKLIRTLFEEYGTNHHEIIDDDLKLSKSYKKVKQLMDCMHRNIIDDVLNKFNFTEEDLAKLNGNKVEMDVDDEQINEKDPFAKIRERVAIELDKKSKIMFDKKILNQSNNSEDSTDNDRDQEKKEKKKSKCELEKWLDIADEKYLELGKSDKIDKGKIKDDLVRMQGFFTYFNGFNENRKNVYSKDKISTAIPFRIIHDNFPVFKQNMENYAKIANDPNLTELKQSIDKIGANEIFQLNYFNQCLTQEGINRYNQEKLGIVAIQQGVEQSKGINQIINEYVQRKNKEIKENTPKGERPKKIKIATFDKLKKQILSINKTKSFQFEVFESTQEIIAGINKRYDFLTNAENNSQRLMDELKYFLQNIDNYELTEVYLNTKSVAILSKKLFNYGRYIELSLEKWYDDKINKSGNDKRKFLEAKQFSIQLIQDSINYYLQDYEQNQVLKDSYSMDENFIVSYFKNPTITVDEKQENNTIQVEKPLFEELETRKNNINYILNEEYKKDLKEEKTPNGDAEKVKYFLDALLEFGYILSPFAVKDKNLEKDEEFYNERKRLQELLFEAEILELYNQTRNYITRKTYTLDKFKLTFDTPTLLGGWDKNKETSNKTILLLKNNSYYLGILDKNNNAVFEDNNINIDKLKEKIVEEERQLKEKEEEIKTKKAGTKTYDKLESKIQSLKNQICSLRKTINLLRNQTEAYNKVDYKYFKDCTTMIPKCSIQTNAVKSHFKNSSTNFTVKENTSLSKNGETFIKELVITKEIFDLNNMAFDKKTNCFVEKKSDDTRPKKFQKKYLDQSKDQEGYSDAIAKWIQYCKSFLESYESTATAGYDYATVFSDKYENISDFYKKLNQCIYKITTERTISSAYIEDLVQEGKLYLFKIHNKDFNPGSKGKKNLHTLYWEMLFDPKNLDDVVFKLNGGAELFYREASIKEEKKIIHKAGDKVPKKFFTLSDGTLEPVPGESIKKLNAYFQGKLQKYDLTEIDLKYINNYSIIGHKDCKEGIVKDERFTKDKIQFHCSITMNFKPKNENINNKVLAFLHRNEDVHIIGLDRGERNLIYLTMINKEGKIVDGMQFSLNELEQQTCVNGTHITKKVDYQTLLHSKEVNRAEARKNWQTIENIKELKEGYLSLVVHQLAKLIIEKNAIVVMEDLNYGFKDSRAKVDKQIYQKFENMLVKKLQYLVLEKDENQKNSEGGVLKAYQLVKEEIPAYKNMGKQNGILFYVPADYTSKIDPVTGFINLLDTRYINRKNAIEFLGKFKTIYYDTTHHYFRFEFDYKDFNNLRVDASELSQTEWSICSHALAKRSMSVQLNNKWIRQQINVNDQLIRLFKEKNIAYNNGNCLKKSIINIQDAAFFEELLKCLSALLSLRHTWKDENNMEHDTIVSSVELKKGSNTFFSSEVEIQKGKTEHGKWKSVLPVDADANGAYNIARKGLWLLKQLDKTEEKEKAVAEFNGLKEPKEITFEKGDKKKKKVSQWCPNKEWLQFVQKTNK